MGFEDIRIREVSRISGQWTPPIGAMGGPPAHELYRDLVAYADLQLFRDARSRPWAVLRDGAQRRAFPVPSAVLRSALDRFRMRRNLRPVPEGDIEEFARIVEAHISDPDVEIPTLQAPVVDPSSSPPGEGPAPRTLEELDEHRDRLRKEVESMLTALESDSPMPVDLPEDPPAEAAPRRPRPRIPIPAIGSAPLVDPTVSGAQPLAAPDGALPRYLRVFQELVQDGGWMGTTRELSDRTGDDPFQVFETLLRYRSDLATQGILLANIEVDDGFRWLVVNRSRIHDESQPDPSTVRAA